MKIKKVWAIFFSPTDTTKKVVCRIADNLASGLSASREDYDFTLPKKRTDFPSVSGEAGDLIVFGTPTYAGRVPNVLLKYLASIKGNGAQAIPVVTFGNRNFDNSLLELKDILLSAEFRPIAAAAFSCEHSFSYTLGAGRPDKCDFIELDDFSKNLCRLILENNISDQLDLPGIPQTYGGYYKPQDRNGIHIDIRKVTPKVSDNCTNCGICASVCPMGSIDPDNVKAMTGICIKCGACFKKCPVSARYFDDEGYLYHKTELEEIYTRRASNRFFI